MNMRYWREAVVGKLHSELRVPSLWNVKTKIIGTTANELNYCAKVLSWSYETIMINDITFTLY